ncbi:MAG: arginyltransferase [Myxococcota bacterium]
MNRLASLPLLVDRHPAELLVHDQVEECPYLAGRTARMPLRLPIRALQPPELDARLEAGDRRHGALFYRPSCDRCNACEAIRLRAKDFTFSKSQKRALARGDRLLTTTLGPPRVSPERVALYDAHRFGRRLAGDDQRAMEPIAYQRFLVDRHCDAFELRFEHEGRLVGVAITDRAARSLSAVYCYYDPEIAKELKLGIGTYSILSQVRLCRDWDLEHLYLGLYIRGCAAMEYKARFTPHERLVDGAWTRFPADP